MSTVVPMPVWVMNPAGDSPAPYAGLTEAQLQALFPLPVTLAAAVAGTWDYASGVSGSVTIGAGRRVLTITAIAGLAGGTLTVAGGDTITIPPMASLTLSPAGALVAPELVFAGTTAYVVEHVG